MVFDSAMNDLFPDEVTIEPYSSNSVTQEFSYGAAVLYKAQITSEWSKSVGKDGRALKSSTVILIPERVHIDPRDRITLPSGWVPNQPPIISSKPVGGVSAIGLDHTEIRC